MEKECAIADCHSPATETFGASVTHVDHVDQRGEVYDATLSVEIAVCKSCSAAILKGTIVIPPDGLKVKEFRSVTK